MWRMLGSRLVPAGLSGSGRADWPDGVAMPWRLRNAGLGGLGPERTGTRSLWRPCGPVAAGRACGSRAGLRQPGREAERREQPGVDEVVMPGDPVPGGLDDLDRPRLAPAVRGRDVGPERRAPVGSGGDQARATAVLARTKEEPFHLVGPA